MCVTDIRRALPVELDQAFAMVSEYYVAERVMVREDREGFEKQYFGDGVGVWLASCGGEDIGCIALRSLDETSRSSEIKRLYVRPAYRGRGVADLLLLEVEDFARKSGYDWIYLDTAAPMLAAARFYQRHQFERCEKYNDNPQAALFLRKRLNAGCGKPPRSGK